MAEVAGERTLCFKYYLSICFNLAEISVLRGFDFIPGFQWLEVQKHQSSVLIGETGSGKTTQVLELLHVEGLRQNAF